HALRLVLTGRTPTLGARFPGSGVRSSSGAPGLSARDLDQVPTYLEWKRGCCRGRQHLFSAPTKNSPGARDLSRRNAGKTDPRLEISRLLRRPIFLWTKVRAPFARPANTLNTYKLPHCSIRWRALHYPEASALATTSCAALPSGFGSTSLSIRGASGRRVLYEGSVVQQRILDRLSSLICADGISDDQHRLA